MSRQEVRIDLPILQALLSIYPYSAKASWSLLRGFCVWWLGENLINISYYIADAMLQRLPLLGGGVHDWGFLLGRMGKLHRAEIIGRNVFILGSLIIIGSLIWMGWLIWRLYKYGKEEVERRDFYL